MKKVKAFMREFRSLLLFVSLLMLFRTTYADWAPVPSGSMEWLRWPCRSQANAKVRALPFQFNEWTAGQMQA